MRPLEKFDDKYFKKYKTKLVKIKPYNPKQKQIANKEIEKLRKLLDDKRVNIIIRGSTAFEILGKGDVEVGVYPKANSWDTTPMKLRGVCGEPDNLEKDYARFNLEHQGCEIEIIVLKGYEAKLDRALTQYLQQNPDLLEEYVGLKKKYKYSKREYQIQKNNFFIKVSRLIPNNFLTD